MRTLILFLLTAISCLGQLTTYVILGASAPYTDSQGNVWSVDSGCSGAATYSTTNNISGTPDPTLYQSGRYGVGPIGCVYTVTGYYFYTITLNFANTQGELLGQNLFNIYINNVRYQSNFDLTAGPGGCVINTPCNTNTAVSLSFGPIPSTGSFTISLAQTTGNVILSSISIINYGIASSSLVINGPLQVNGNLTATGYGLFGGNLTANSASAAPTAIHFTDSGQATDFVLSAPTNGAAQTMYTPSSTINSSQVLAIGSGGGITSLTSPVATAACGAGAGSGSPSCTASGGSNNFRGVVTVVTGNTAGQTNVTIFTLTFGVGLQPASCVWSPGNVYAAASPGALVYQTAPSAGTTTLVSGGTALTTGGTTFVWFYHCDL